MILRECVTSPESDKSLRLLISRIMESEKWNLNSRAWTNITIALLLSVTCNAQLSITEWSGPVISIIWSE